MEAPPSANKEKDHSHRGQLHDEEGVLFILSDSINCVDAHSPNYTVLIKGGKIQD